jgi:integrase
MHSYAVPNRNHTVSRRPQPQPIFTAGMKKPAQSAQDVKESSFYSGCPTPDTREIKQSGRSPYIHIHSPGKACPACQALELDAMEDSFAELTFSEAFPLWFYNHIPSISPNTQHYYKQYANALMPFFGPYALKDIGLGQIRGFQRWRSNQYDYSETLEIPLDSPLLNSKYRHAAGNVRIKNEINCVLKPMLREAGQWAAIKEKKFKHLPIPREGSGIALSKEQWGQIFTIAFEQQRWMVAGHCLQIMLRGGFGFGELRRARRRDLDIRGSKLTIVEGAKNGERERTVELVPSALESAKWLVARWEKLGGKTGDQYLLPLRSTIKNCTLNRPMVSINFAWNAIKKEWTARHPDQARGEARQYDARVSCATLLLVNPKLSLPLIEKALGWTPNSNMRKRYHRATQELIREALLTLEDGQ